MSVSNLDSHECGPNNSCLLMFLASFLLMFLASCFRVGRETSLCFLFVDVALRAALTVEKHDLPFC